MQCCVTYYPFLNFFTQSPEFYKEYIKISGKKFGEVGNFVIFSFGMLT